jgi:DNA-directed RNA polymerase specialized sigma24 family protein
MMSNSHNSVTEWLQQTQEGQESAVGRLWERYFEQLVAVARRRLGHAKPVVVDEEDLAAAVLTSFIAGVQNGRIRTLQNREHMWRLLEIITQRRAADTFRSLNAAKRGGYGEVERRAVSNAELPVRVDDVADRAPAPGFEMELREELQRLRDLLPSEDFREIAELKLKGFSNREIAEQTGRSLRSVERKMSVIRRAWLQEIIR